ncbi:NRDE family protein [Cystobacter fuscus]
MCTLLAFRHVHPEWPLLLAANRDERHDRPAEGPQVLVPSPGSSVAGTWSGWGRGWG